jgi:hypothetical protein
VARTRSLGLRRLALALGLALGFDLGAQDTVAVERRTFSGRVVQRHASGERGVPRQRVSLHRISRDSAGPVDSLLTDAAGRYRFTFTARDDGSVYVAGATFGDVAYFTTPTNQPTIGGTDGEITVFDTTSRPIPVRVRGRHVIVSAPAPSGLRTLVEVYEISNDTLVTRIAGGSEGATWRGILPRLARSPRGGRGDVPEQAMRFRDGVVEIFAPIAPGLRQVAFSYELPPDAFPLSLPLGDSASVFEVLLEERSASAAGPQLMPRESVTIEGRSFQRYLAQNVAGSAVVQLTVDAVASASAVRGAMPFVVVGTAAAVLVVLAAVSARRRSHPATLTVRTRATPAPLEPNEVDLLAHEIARLDAAMESTRPDAPGRSEYDVRRRELMARLTTLLARSS